MISTHATIDLEVWEGATFYQEFVWMVDDPPVPVDLDGVTARMQVRDEIEDDETIFDLTTENGGVVIVDASEGKYAIILTPDQTAGLCTDHEKRSFVYDLFFYHGTDDDAGLQQRGKMVINPAVTRPEEP